MRLLKLFLLISVVSASLFAQRGGGHGGGGGVGRAGGGFSGGGARGGGAAVSRGGAYGVAGGYRGGYGVAGGYHGGYYGGYHGGYYGHGYYGHGHYYGGVYVGAYWGWPYSYGWYGWPYYSSYPAYPYGGYCDPYYGCSYGTSGYSGGYGADPGYGYVSTSYQPAPQAPPVVVNQSIGTSAPASDSFYRAPDYYLIAFNDHTIRAAASYRLDGGVIYWTSREGDQMQAPLSNVDRRFSEQINRDRRVAFPLP